jgi:hypothetical protein
MLDLSKRQILAQSRINSSAIEMAAMKELPASPLNEAPPPITPKSDSRQIVVRRFSQKKQTEPSHPASNRWAVNLTTANTPSSTS